MRLSPRSRSRAKPHVQQRHTPINCRYCKSTFVLIFKSHKGVNMRRIRVIKGKFSVLLVIIFAIVACSDSKEPSGSVTQVSDSDGEVLKWELVRSLKNRGFESIYVVDPWLQNFLQEFRGPNASKVGSFVVPRKSRNLLFYSFLSDGDASMYPIVLTSPSGELFKETTNHVAMTGSFNGLQISNPEPGEWKYNLESDDVVRPFELRAYVNNPKLDTSVRIIAPTGSEKAQAGYWKVEVQVVNRYPLTDVDSVTAYLFQLLQNNDTKYQFVRPIEIYDDGNQGGDASADDGIYSGIFQIDRDMPPQVAHVDVRFVVGPSARPAANVLYEVGTTYNEIFDDYKINGRPSSPHEVWARSTYVRLSGR